MARIPHIGGTQSTFGQRGPDRIGPYNPNTGGMTAGTDAIAQSAGALAGTAAHLGQQIRQEDDDLARARATNALLDQELQIRARTEDLQQRVQSGDLNWREAADEAAKAFDEIESPHIDGLAPADIERLNGGFARNKLSGALQVRNIADAAKRVEFRGQFDTALDSLGKLANAPGADIAKINDQAAAFAPLAQQAGVDAAVTSAKIQAFKDRNWTNQATQRAIGARDDAQALSQLEHDLTAQDGFYVDKLDTDKRNVLLSQITSAKARLESKAQHETDKREAAAGRAVTQAQQQASTGVQAPIETQMAWAEAVRGTSFEGEFQEMLKGEAQVQAILNRPPAEQTAYLQQLRAQQQKAGATVAQQGNLKRLETAVETNLKQLRDAPLVFYSNRTGTTVAPLDLTVLASGDIDGLQAQISERMNTIATVRKQFGPEAGSAPLLPQEASALASALAQAPPAAVVKVYGAMSRAFNDPEAYKAAIQQVAPDSPVRALAGIVYAQQRSTTLQPGGIFSGAVKASAGDVAQTLLTGEQLLNRSKSTKAEDGKAPAFPMPPPKEFGDAVAVELGDVFAGRPGAYETSLQAVRAYYAGTASKAGDVTGELDPKRLREAVRAVLGQPVDVNGNGDVLPPWGMEEDAFEDKLDIVWAQALSLLPPGVSTDFGDYGLRQRGDGVYYVVGAGGEFLSGKNGQPIQLRVSP